MGLFKKLGNFVKSGVQKVGQVSKHVSARIGQVSKGIEGVQKIASGFGEGMDRFNEATGGMGDFIPGFSQVRAGARKVENVAGKAAAFTNKAGGVADKFSGGIDAALKKPAVVAPTVPAVVEDSIEKPFVRRPRPPLPKNPVQRPFTGDDLEASKAKLKPPVLKPPVVNPMEREDPFSAGRDTGLAGLLRQELAKRRLKYEPEQNTGLDEPDD